MSYIHVDDLVNFEFAHEKGLLNLGLLLDLRKRDERLF